MKTGPLFAVALLALASMATPTLACSIGRLNAAELRLEQGRDFRDADLVFLARVVAHGVPDDPDLDLNVVFYQSIERVSGSAQMPEALSVAVFYCLPLPPVGETQVILMRSADVSGAPDRTSPVLGYYDVSDVQHASLRRRVEWALQRANIQ